tara:strand:+ start:68 stop:259 length:192 start_codon:yes stop_codon:yes gene_type:complete
VKLLKHFPAQANNNHGLLESAATTLPSVQFAARRQKWDVTLHAPAAVARNIRSVMEPELMDLQ